MTCTRQTNVRTKTLYCYIFHWHSYCVLHNVRHAVVPLLPNFRFRCGAARSIVPVSLIDKMDSGREFLQHKGAQINIIIIYAIELGISSCTIRPDSLLGV